MIMAIEPSLCALARRGVGGCLQGARSATLALAGDRQWGHRGPFARPPSLCPCPGPTLALLSQACPPHPVSCQLRGLVEATPRGPQFPPPEHSPSKPSQGSAQTPGLRATAQGAPGLWLRGQARTQGGQGLCVCVCVSGMCLMLRMETPARAPLPRAPPPCSAAGPSCPGVLPLVPALPGHIPSSPTLDLEPLGVPWLVGSLSCSLAPPRDSRDPQASPS